MSKYWLFLVFGIMLFSCMREEGAMIQLEEGILGDVSQLRGGGDSLDTCFVFVFPVEVLYPDSTIKSYDNLDTLLADFAVWKQRAHHGVHPEFVFPVEIILAGDSTTTEILDEATLRSIIHDCLGKGDRRSRGHDSWAHRHHCHLPTGVDSCYDLVLPVTLTYPDSSTLTFDQIDSLKAHLKEWSDEDGDCPEYVYPIEVWVYGDTINTQIDNIEALEEMDRQCLKEGDHGRGGKHGGRKGGRKGKKGRG